MHKNVLKIPQEGTIGGVLASGWRSHPWLIGLMLAACSFLPTISISAQSPQIQSGVLDLRGWNPDSEISLTGEWKFSWMQFSSGSPIDSTQTFSVPGFWNGKTLDSQRLTAEGYATYSLKILGPVQGLALKIVDMESAYALYADGKLIASNGTVGRSRDEEKPEWKPIVAPLNVGNETTLVLVVSNFHHRLGGIWQGMQLGSLSSMSEAHSKTIGFELFLAGSLFMIAIYHCLVFSVRRKEEQFLLLGIFCLIMCLRTLVTGERFILAIVPAMSWDLLIRLDYLTVPLGLMIAHWYLSNIFRTVYHRPMFYILIGILGPCILAEIFLAPRIFSYLAPIHGLVVSIWSLYFLVIGFVAILRGMAGAAIMWVGWLISVVANAHDSLYVESIFQSRYMFAIGLQAFILTQSYYLASQYSAAFSLSEMLADRMKSLLALTRELNRSSERDSAIWTAIAEIRNVIRAEKEEITAYVPVRDSRLFQKISEDGPHVSIPVELSERLYSLSAPQSEGTIVRIPVRVSDVCLCVLEMNLTTSLQLEAMTREKPYVEGILDSLRLVLDNIQRVQRDALARIGQTASEIVHDINHHCKTIEAHTKTARMSPEAGAHAIAEIDREVTFMKNLAFDILDYAREQLIVRPVLEEITVVAHRIEEDLEEVFRDTQINHSVTENYKGKVRIDLERFRRVVLNLARNALTALGGKGRFSVSIEHQENACCFLFEDDGPGVSDDLTDLLFEPFASGGRGTGLGLAVVKRIIVAHGGDVRVSSTAGHGCRFLVELPA